MFFVVALAASLSIASTDVECESGLWRCDDGQCVEATACNGELQCRDGSDESLARCKGTQRPLLALILHCSQPGGSSHAVCPDACRRWPEYCYYAIAAENGVPGACELPPYPSVGDYSIEAIEPARGGTGLADFTLLYSCPPGFNLYGNQPRCVSGSWTADFPSCDQGRRCQLKKHASVDYYCIDVRNYECPKWVGSGQRVSAVCRLGYWGEVSTPMHCVDGSWDYVAICRSDCGTTSINPERGRRGGLPWHATVYSKRKTAYDQLCGGSLISTKVVISVAHCFWTEGRGVGSAGLFAVGVGKTYRRWDTVDDGQKSNVSDIKVPARFSGMITYYQDDIAVVLLATRMMITLSVRPVCVDFGAQFEMLQLRPGNVGKMAGWNLTPEQKTLEMASVNTAQCINEVPPDFVPFLLSDMMCARPMNGTAICKGDSGGGLVFPTINEGVERWYLRGIASRAVRNNVDCYDSYIAFTQLTTHQAFITANIREYA